MKVDREALERMVLLRKQFYENFCRRGLKEVEEDVAAGRIEEGTIAGMKAFMSWVVAWMDRSPSSLSSSSSR